MTDTIRNLAARIAVILTVASFAGCQKCGWNGPAGSMNQQQAVAAIHDPFPFDDVGPSDGTQRPPGFEQPLPEAVRDRIGPDSMPWLGQ